MNRCTVKLMAILAMAMMLAMASLTVQAQPQDEEASLLVTRKLPQDALLGRLLVQQPPDAMLNGQPARLAPGIRIRDENNQIAMSGALAGQSFPVKYLLDSSGLVSQAWILTAAEVRASRKSFSLRNFLLGNDTATGPVDDGKTPFDQLPRFSNQLP